MLTVRDCIDLAGGPVAIAQELAKRGETTTSSAVYKWANHSPYGIPEVHWSAVIALSGHKVTPADLHQANELRRASKKRATH
jgi:hypothetical protein